jgi:5-methyltetrahydropteroyltriglutamate--homocysteine methyltransferase
MRLQAVTDGEFRRISYWEKFVRLTHGLEVKDAVFTFHDAEGHESKFTAPYVSGKVSRAEPIALDELGFGNNKVTLPAPSTMHFYRFTDWGNAYDKAETFFRDLGKVYQAEIADLAKAGCKYVQIDEVAVAILCDAAARAKVKAQGENPDRLVDLYIDAINEAVKNRPAGMTVGVHVCRGNYKGMYLSEGGYDSVAERFFSRTNVDHFLLEFDTPRAGGFEPLRFVPGSKGRRARSGELQDAAAGKMISEKRGREAARYLDLATWPSARNAASPAPWAATRDRGRRARQAAALRRRGAGDLGDEGPRSPARPGRALLSPTC